MKSILALLIFSSTSFASVKTEVCSMGKTVKKVELVSDAAAPCKITYQGAEKWHFKKEISKCEPAFIGFIAHLEKKGFSCKTTTEAKLEVETITK